MGGGGEMNVSVTFPECIVLPSATLNVLIAILFLACIGYSLRFRKLFQCGLISSKIFIM